MNEHSPVESLFFPYGTGTWLCWIVLLFLAGWLRRWRGIVLGELTVMTWICLLKFRWLQEAMTSMNHRERLSADHWFFLAAVLSAFGVGVILLPAGLLGLLTNYLTQKPPEAAPPPPLPR